MNKVWVVKMLRTIRYSYTGGGSYSSFVDSVWESKEDAMRYLDKLANRYDANRNIWYVEYKNEDMNQTDAYEICPIDFNRSENGARTFHLEHIGGRTWKDFELGSYVQHMRHRRKLKTSEEAHMCIDSKGELCIVGTGGESYWFTEKNPDMIIVWDN